MASALDKLREHTAACGRVELGSACGDMQRPGGYFRGLGGAGVLQVISEATGLAGCGKDLNETATELAMLKLELGLCRAFCRCRTHLARRALLGVVRNGAVRHGVQIHDPP